MGCDGGTIPTRDELVRLKKKPEQKDKTANIVARWKHCAITQDPLREPIMACELGRLYNKESVLELLIDRSKFECASSFDHLRGLKDVKQLNLTKNRNYSHVKSEKGDSYIETHDSKYICPVVGLEMNGTYNFCLLWGCGCVLSERAMKEVKGETCHKCGKPFIPEDIILINGTEEEIEGLRSRMQEKRQKQKLEKKSKKGKRTKCETEASTSADSDCVPSKSKQPKLDQSTTDSKLANGTKASKLSIDTKQKLTNGSTGKSLNGHADLLKTNGSIQKDPKASAAYKSLFTSSDRAKNQMKGHWVTTNPYWM